MARPRTVEPRQGGEEEAWPEGDGERWEMEGVWPSQRGRAGSRWGGSVAWPRGKVTAAVHAHTGRGGESLPIPRASQGQVGTGVRLGQRAVGTPVDQRHKIEAWCHSKPM